MFGEERLIELVAKHAANDDRKIIDTVMQAVRQWTGLPETFGRHDNVAGEKAVAQAFLPVLDLSLSRGSSNCAHLHLRSILTFHAVPVLQLVPILVLV